MPAGEIANLKGNNFAQRKVQVGREALYARNNICGEIVLCDVGGNEYSEQQINHLFMTISI